MLCFTKDKKELAVEIKKVLKKYGMKVILVFVII